MMDDVSILLAAEAVQDTMLIFRFATGVDAARPLVSDTYWSMARVLELVRIVAADISITPDRLHDTWRLHNQARAERDGTLVLEYRDISPVTKSEYGVLIAMAAGVLAHYQTT